MRGHSGADVTLMDKGTKAFVRKSAGGQTQNARLVAQCRKQVAFYEKGLPCPRVIGEGREAGLFFFDMEYVPGTSIAHQCQSGLVPHRHKLAEFLQTWLMRFKASSSDYINPLAFQKKLDVILGTCRSNALLWPMRPMIETHVRQLSHQDWSGIPMSDCHGDLTLENILARSTKYCFIDLDVPDLPSYFMDVGKLFQDLVGMWCLRRLALDSPGTLRFLNAQIALSTLRVTLGELVYGVDPTLTRRMPSLVALNLLRALPYCRDEATAVFTLGRIETVWQQAENFSSKHF